ncbi:MAG TPA: rhodanese-like domain-containing protein [Candidatus Binataceae bacterium]|nr:rhodanese-like domain-containing protein [Candidatus Binataceae bacterium]
MRDSILGRFFSRRAIIAGAMALAIFAAGAPASAFDLLNFITNDPAPPDQFKVIHVKDLAAMIAAKNPPVYIYDANHWSLRSSVGMIPGAHLLTSPDQYDVTGTLPPDKHAELVFYCAETRCMASHEAARRATDAGYTDVSVMADGIIGWKSAGQPIATPGNLTTTSKDD